MRCIPNDQTDNNSPLVQVMASHQTVSEPLHEVMMIQSIDAYIHHQALMG